MLIQFQRINLEEVDNKILIHICEGCYNEINERYNPDNQPPSIQKGVFVEEFLGRKQ
jgi:protein-arginine kinase activator protein McsA